MPKRNFVMTKLPVMKPDCCAECPLIGKIPQERREYGSYETLICLGTMDAMTQRQSNIRASKRDSKHPLHRYCDTRWEAWQQLGGREFPIAIEVYNVFRMPYELLQQPMIRFHKRGRPRKTKGREELGVRRDETPRLGKARHQTEEETEEEREAEERGTVEREAEEREAAAAEQQLTEREDQSGDVERKDQSGDAEREDQSGDAERKDQSGDERRERRNMPDGNYHGPDVELDENGYYVRG